MKNFFQSFYFKLSAIFLILLLLISIIQIVISFNASKKFHTVTEQSTNRALAKAMASEFEQFLTDSIDVAAIEHMIHYMMVINPRIEIYLLDEQGTILAYFAGPGKQLKATSVGLAPIRTFLKGEEELPIYGDDPRHPGRKKIFSAAPLRIKQEIDGYLYIIIESEKYDDAAAMFYQGFMTRTVVKGVLISVIVTGVLGLIFFALLTRRLHRITRVMQAFERGQLNERVPVEKNDEISYLAQSFNNLAESVVSNMEEMKRTDQLRRELVANISHDLRNPLASIKGYLETIQLKDTQLEPTVRQQYLETTLKISDMLEKLVDELFQLSKLDSHQIQPHLESFFISDLLQDIIMKFKPIAEKKQIQLKAELPEQLPQVYADIGLIERALSNLIDNALRYTDCGGTVKVKIFQEDQKIRVSISDTGCGIRQEELPLIFDRFYRVEKSRSRSTGGAGLGLAIARKILELHKTTISVESRENEGTTFSFYLNTWQHSNLQMV